ncbi:hypothetical protein [Kitasatospora phosalacinea]|uniref:hypothetical protein n=1 Tax=Kitasatospora phosalacinea TaxID=2065 RepID=UPI002554A6B0|nr:hypothetical protein [Kitasatospora phosalacinea]
MDELLRARQFAAQRERRLAEAVRGGREPDHAPAYGRPPRQPDPELLRQLAQVQHLREGLGARCLELSDRLLAAEDRQLAGRLANGPSPAPQGTPRGLAEEPRPRRPAEPTGPAASPVPPQRQFPTGARFGGGHRPAPVHDRGTAPDGSTGTTDAGSPYAPPAIEAPQLRGARFRISRPPRPAQQDDDHTASPVAPPRTDSGRHDAAARGSGPDTEPEGPVGTSWAGTRVPRTGLAANRAGSENSGSSTGSGPGSPGRPASGPRPRTGAELIALVQRIADLHRQGAVHESAALVGRAALMVTPVDLAALATLLRAEGPAGSSTYLARSVAGGAPEHAAAALAELRREGLVDEAADLFHSLWSVSAQVLPTLLAALAQSGQSADGQTMLWERASAPAAELSELTRQLRAAGRSDDVRHLLRQAAGRPAGEVAAIAAALDGESAAELVGELVRMRSASDVGQFAAEVRDSAELYDAMLSAADGLEESRTRSVLAALRTAGLPTESAPRSRPKSRLRR